MSALARAAAWATATSVTLFACGSGDSGPPPLSSDVDVIQTDPAATGGRQVKAMSSPLPRAQWGKDKCASKRPEGTGAGQRVRQMILKDCDGKEVSLDDYCGAAAIWLFIGHGWCPNCKKTAGFADEIAREYADRGVVVVNLLGQDAEYHTPTAEFCRAWRDKYGLTDTVVMFDSYGDQAKSFENGATPIQVFIDVDHVIASRANTSTPSVIRAQIDSALARVPLQRAPDRGHLTATDAWTETRRTHR